jgi:uncharacterized protein YqgC (DUF456 family)
LEPHDLLAGLGILVGLVGVVIVVLPGLLIIVGSVAFWAVVEQSAAGWVALALAGLIGIAATVLKYLHPGRRLRELGIPTTQLLLALAVAIFGFFAIPVVGAFIGFLAAIYVTERLKHGGPRARQSTWATTTAIALSIGIELGGGFLIAAVWLAAALFG